ncbi:unnamed protein product [Triticum turgidum subsp. durum]|uniref:F-box domain-containing protein n=1 Tax=Triticum turgidum subsp. durum TaxID=4567 RepID=A0A9R0YYF9_TRITD|nr:unnamed protein product [Triticum turgidum subsp. durum]
MKSNRGRRHQRNSKTEVGSGDMLSKLPGDIQACNGDRLSELPADVLLNILERVGTLDAVRACILSKQMQKLPAMLSQIVIDLSPRDLFQKSDVVADVTNKILSRRPPHITIRKLKLKFVLSPSRCLSIGKSVGLAMATQKFDAAEFEILTPKDSHICTDAHRELFAMQFNNFVRDCPDAFAGLTRLHLRNMSFGESDIPNILRYCKVLESLSFFMCGAGISSVLHVEHTRLTELVISYCEFKKKKGNWPCDESPLILGFVPQLSKLSLPQACLSRKTLNLSQLLANVPTVSGLYLEFRSEKVRIRPECPKVLAPVLTQLRSVSLDNLPEECDISWTMFLLEAAPSVEDLCITVWDHKCRKESQKSRSRKMDVHWEPSDPDFKHKNLARLTIYGFQSDDNFIGYVRRVIQAAANIREVSLHDRKVCRLCCEKFPHLGVRPSSYPRTSEEVDLLMNMTAVPATACPDIHFCS